MLRVEALVFPDLACFRVTVQVVFFFGATKVLVFTTQPPAALHVCLPVPTGLMRDDNDTELPRFSVLVTTAGVAAEVAAGVVPVVSVPQM
jgi:hypothetical protein